MNDVEIRPGGQPIKRHGVRYFELNALLFPLKEASNGSFSPRSQWLSLGKKKVGHCTQVKAQRERATCTSEPYTRVAASCADPLARLSTCCALSRGCACLQTANCKLPSTELFLFFFCAGFFFLCFPWQAQACSAGTLRDQFANATCATALPGKGATRCRFLQVRVTAQGRILAPWFTHSGQ